MPKAFSEREKEIVKAHLWVHQRSLGIDDERAAKRQPRSLIIYAEHAWQLSGRVLAHRIGHIGQLFLMTLPGQVHELCVGADGDDLSAHLLEAIVLLCQSSKLSRSHEGEIGGIEEQDGPLALRL